MTQSSADTDARKLEALGYVKGRYANQCSITWELTDQGWKWVADNACRQELKAEIIEHGIAITPSWSNASNKNTRYMHHRGMFLFIQDDEDAIVILEGDAAYKEMKARWEITARSQARRELRQASRILETVPGNTHTAHYLKTAADSLL